MRHRFNRTAVALTALLSLFGCSVNDSSLSDSDFLAYNETTPARSVPAGAVQATPGTELVGNGAFLQGEAGWAQSTRRGEVGVAGTIIGPLPGGVPVPPNGQSTVARLCGYRTLQASGGGSTSITCNDILSSLESAAVAIPRGTSGVTISALAYASYACAGDNAFGDGHGALVMALRPIDGQAITAPSGLNAKEATLPAGSWQRVLLDVTSIPGIADQDRRFKLLVNFSTGPGCKPPRDENTFVVLTDISVRTK